MIKMLFKLHHWFVRVHNCYVVLILLLILILALSLFIFIICISCIYIWAHLNITCHCFVIYCLVMYSVILWCVCVGEGGWDLYLLSPSGVGHLGGLIVFSGSATGRFAMSPSFSPSLVAINKLTFNALKTSLKWDDNSNASL